MPKYNNPRKTWEYSQDFKAKRAAMTGTPEESDHTPIKKRIEATTLSQTGESL